MKKNITINLSGRLFQIDEDAYEMLKSYTESLRSAFGNQDGGDEIVEDIEARIAELFDELEKNGTAAISIEHVKEIITRIGDPGELAGDNSADNTDSKNKTWEDKARSAAKGIYESARERTRGKHLYRNPNDKVIAGVLSGIGMYTGTDPIIWRLLMILLTCFSAGFGFVLYIILAIIIPEAKTPDERLKMQGIEVTPNNIANEVVDNGNRQHDSGVIRTLFSVIVKIIFGFILGITIFSIGIVLLSLLIALIACLTALSLPVSSEIPSSLGALGLADLYATHPAVIIVFVISIIAFLAIPIYGFIHWLSTHGKPDKKMGIAQRTILIFAWIAALLCMVPSGMRIAREGFAKNDITIEKLLQEIDDDNTYTFTNDSLVVTNEDSTKTVVIKTK